MSLFDSLKEAATSAFGNISANTPLASVISAAQGNCSLAQIEAHLSDPQARAQLLAQLSKSAGVEFDAANNQIIHNGTTYSLNAENLVNVVKAHVMQAA